MRLCVLLVEPYPQRLGYTAFKSRLNCVNELSCLLLNNEFKMQFFLFQRMKVIFNCCFNTAVKFNFLFGHERGK